jgi:hypothetical protein
LNLNLTVMDGNSNAEERRDRDYSAESSLNQSS